MVSCLKHFGHLGACLANNSDIHQIRDAVNPNDVDISVDVSIDVHVDVDVDLGFRRKPPLWDMYGRNPPGRSFIA